MPGAVPWWANSLLSTLLALVVAAAAVSFDRRKTVNQELIRKRIAAYAEVAPLLTDIRAFFYAIGAPLPLDPPQVVQHKVELDRQMEIHGPLFSERLSHLYWDFTRAIFDTTHGDWNQPAKLKLNLAVFKLERTDWQSDWDRLFAPDGQDMGDFLRCYHALMDQFAVEIGARSQRAHWLTRYRKRRRGL